MYECPQPLGEEVLFLVLCRDLVLTTGDLGGTLLEGFGIFCTSS